MDGELIIKSMPSLLSGLIVTLEISVISILIATLVGLLIGLFRVSKSKILNSIAVFYSNFLRGMPIIVQLFIVYFAIPSLLDINVRPFIACVIACSMNSSAYISEIVRAGILGVDKGQTEAGKSLGLSDAQIMYFIIFPQALRRILPALGNEFIGLLKGTSILSVIGMQELTREGQLIIARTYATFEVWMVVTLLYLGLVLILSQLVNFLERRLND